MSYYGDFKLGSTINYKFTSRQFSTGAPFALASGTAVAYVGTSTTEITAGITLTPNFDGRTGLNDLTVVTSAANGYARGANYAVALSAGTVDGVSVVGEVLFTFSVENRYVPGLLVRTTISALSSQTSFTLAAGSTDANAYVGATIVISDATSEDQRAIGVISAYTAGRVVTLLADPAIYTMATGDVVEVFSDRSLKATVPTRTLDVSATGEAGLDWANLGSPTTAQTLSNTIVGQVTLLNGLAANTITAASIATGAIDRDALAPDTGLQSIRSNALQAGSTTSAVVLDTGASATDDFYNNCLILFTSGNALGQMRRIRDYVGSSKTATLARALLGTAPAAADTFVIMPEASVWDEFVADHVLPNTFGAVEGQSLTTSELLDQLVGPVATVVVNGANTATVFQVDITTVSEAAADWWKDAWFSFDGTAALAHQVKKVTNFNQTTGMITVSPAFTAIPTAGNTARLVTR